MPSGRLSLPDNAAPEGGRCAVVIVNWNGAHLLRDCLGPLADQEFELIVVDNASTDDSVRIVRSEFPAARLIVNEANLGFAVANNQGLRESSAPFVFLLNNDTVPDSDAIAELVSFLEDHPSVAIAGPTLVNVDGTPQDSCGPGPDLATEFLGKSMLHRLLPGRRSWAPTQTRRVDWVTGAALMIRRSVAEQLGGLDEEMFMFYEDLDLCARAREAGHEVWFVATPPIVHVGGATRRNVETKSLVDSFRSTDRFFAVHGPGWRRALVRAFTVPEVALRSLLWTLLAIRRKDRELAKARLAAYGQILRLAVRRG